MAVFQEAMKIVAAHEGGYNNDPDDYGGETFRGITRKNYPSWEGWAPIDAAKRVYPSDWRKRINADPHLYQLAVAFYYSNHWTYIQGNAIKDQGIANHLFDFTMGGMVRAVTRLQEGINSACRQQSCRISEDGRMGPITLSRLNSLKPAELKKVHNYMVQSRLDRYDRLVRENPRQEKWLDGWRKRALRFAQDVKGGSGLVLFLVLGGVAAVVVRSATGKKKAA